MSERVGLIGVGIMGAAMASRFLAAGHRVTVFDTDMHAQQRAQHLGCDRGRLARCGWPRSRDDPGFPAPSGTCDQRRPGFGGTAEHGQGRQPDRGHEHGGPRNHEGQLGRGGRDRCGLPRRARAWTTAGRRRLDPAGRRRGG